MRLARHCRAPVERFFPGKERRYGFLRPPKGSKEAVNTREEDIFFHLDEFHPPMVTERGVEFGTDTPTPEQIDAVVELLGRGQTVVFDLQRTSRGFMADPWCPQALWEGATHQWKSQYPEVATQQDSVEGAASR